jgi:hypothetical protein
MRSKGHPPPATKKFDELTPFHWPPKIEAASAGD